MNECFGEKFIINGNLLECRMFDNSLVHEGESFYEVIRMMQGNLVFFDDHIARLWKSLASRKREPVIDKECLKRNILIITETVKYKNINLKIVFNYRNNSGSYLIYFIESIYPDEEQYRRGVKGILHYAERKDPESKVIDMDLRSVISSRLRNEGAYESLLVNKNNEITEGSRSNIFFIKENELITAPGQMVLNGITRMNLLEICRQDGIPFSLRCVKADQIGKYDSVFLTGTSPVVLPFNSIDNISFSVSHPYIERLRGLYMIKAEESIPLFRKD